MNGTVNQKSASIIDTAGTLVAKLDQTEGLKQPESTLNGSTSPKVHTNGNVNGVINQKDISGTALPVENNQFSTDPMGTLTDGN